MTAHFTIVQTDAEPQSWHVRVVGGNHEPILVGENLSSFDDARTAILAVASMFVTAPDLRGDPHGIDGEWFVSAGGQPTGCRVSYRDERAGSELLVTERPTAENGARCRHCGKPPEADGDHSCPCPYTDAECKIHPLIVATPWPEDEPLGEPPPWPTRVIPPGVGDGS